MHLNITQAELDRCIAEHETVLINLIRETGGSAPPSDGAIITCIKTIAELRKIIPADDKAGRGVQMTPSEQNDAFRRKMAE